MMVKGGNVPTSQHSDASPGFDRQRWVRLGLWLLAATMVYNGIEAIVALWAGTRAESIALVGFGFDSIIELAAASVVLWRFSVEARGSGAEAIEHAERRVHRFVGVTFFALAAYVLLQSAWDLWAREAPSESLVGLVLAGVSLVVMPLVAIWKLRVAAIIQSAALRAEAKETIACSYLSLCLLLGLAANATVGWWWADPTAALLMVPWLIREGKEGWEGEGCCEHD
jgi:divalent metal cation (Fe/Co/Zn/Cd) transporter